MFTRLHGRVDEGVFAQNGRKDLVCPGAATLTAKSRVTAILFVVQEYETAEGHPT